MPIPRKPYNLEDLVRDLVRRVRRLERDRVSVGQWTLTQNENGELVARNAAAGVTKVLAP